MLEQSIHCSGAKQARDRGLKHFTRDKPCPRGHIGVRFIASSGACVVCDREKVKRYRRVNPDKIQATNQRYYKENHRSIRLQQWDYQRNNRGLMNALERKRQADKIKRTPAWADLEAIKQFYKDCPEGYTVDHIIPLRGKTVSGLHVLNNLQYLTFSENSSKGNRYA